MYQRMKKTPNTILMKFPHSFPLFFNQQKSRTEKKNKRIKMKHYENVMKRDGETRQLSVN